MTMLNQHELTCQWHLLPTFGMVFGYVTPTERWPIQRSGIKQKGHGCLESPGIWYELFKVKQLLDLHFTFAESLNGRIAERSMLQFSATSPLSFIATGFCRATSVVGLSFERTCGPMSGSPKIRRFGNTSFSGRVTHRETFGDYSKSQVEDDFGLPLFSNNTKKLPFSKVTMLRNWHDSSDKWCF